MPAVSGRCSRREFLAQCGLCAFAIAGMEAFGPGAVFAQPESPVLKKGLIGTKLSPYFVKLEGNRVRCELCPRRCETAPGERGHCRVRENRNGDYFSLVYGNPCAVHIDPIEKKPFFHVLPSTLSFSLATAGCNLNCKFCQNWEISQANPEETFNFELQPEQVVEVAAAQKCGSIASTYVEPTIFIEYMIDIGKLAGKRGMLNVMHSNGFISPQPLDDLCSNLDAACIDLKGFTQDYYRDMTGGALEPVLETLKHLKRRGIHTEIVNLVVTGKNDDIATIREMCRWIKNELGPEVPLHFSRFYPLYKLKSLEPTPQSTLEAAWKAAGEEGLLFAYIGNVPGHPAENTVCPGCKTVVVERVGYEVKSQRMKGGKCARCGRPIPGIWENT